MIRHAPGGYYETVLLLGHLPFDLSEGRRKTPRFKTMRHLPKFVGLLLGLSITITAVGCDSMSDNTPPDIQPGDVSFLIPLKGVQQFSASATGDHGQLLPRAFFDQVEPLTRIDEPDDLYANLDVVAVRLDPCMLEGRNASDCQSQIRLVFQPVFDDDNPTTRDGTIHAFYSVPKANVLSVAMALAELRREVGGDGTIGIHPAPQTAANLVLAEIGDQRLTQLTFVSVHASDQAWTFGGFKVTPDGLEHVAPVGVADHEQHLTSTGGTETLDATILPPPEIEAGAAAAMGEVGRMSLTEAEFDAGKAAILNLLDPNAHNTGTVDCASCHMATAAALYFESSDGASGVPDVYRNTQNQRMFGFFGREQSISPRVNAETDKVIIELLRLL